MPFIISRVNIDITEDEEIRIKSALGKAIELVPGKSEAYLMIIFEKNTYIWLRGNNGESFAYIEVKIFGNEAHYGYDAFTKMVTEIYSRILSIKPENIYLIYEDIKTWGVRGLTFEN